MDRHLEPPEHLAAETRRLLDESKFPLVSVPRGFLLSVLAALENCPQAARMPEMSAETARLRAFGECPRCVELPHCGRCS